MISFLVVMLDTCYFSRIERTRLDLPGFVKELKSEGKEGEERSRKERRRNGRKVLLTAWPLLPRIAECLACLTYLARGANSASKLSEREKREGDASSRAWSLTVQKISPISRRALPYFPFRARALFKGRPPLHVHFALPPFSLFP